MSKKLLYFDNNSTTKLCSAAEKLMTSWLPSTSNASGASSLSVAGQDLIKEFYNLICKLCNISMDDYEILIMSGATEANCTIIQMVINSCLNLNKKPHIITSKLEHKSILGILENFEDKIDITFLSPNLYGVIDPEDILKAIRPNTVLISIMYANNELGTINPIASIAKIAQEAQIPFHTDAVQVFGKVPIQIDEWNIDALTMSFHKLYGPQGIGLLIIKKSFVNGYQLKSIIAGTQQDGLRGGTESLPLIAGATGALIDTFTDRTKKNEHLKKLRTDFIKSLYTICDKIDYVDILEKEKEGKKEENKKSKKYSVCILGHPEDVIPNTVLLSFIPNDSKTPDFCNVKFKKFLEDKNIIVSIGSACNTTSTKASHVLEAIEAPPIIKRGVLRISFADSTTLNDIKLLVLGLSSCLKFLEL